MSLFTARSAPGWSLLAVALAGALAGVVALRSTGPSHATAGPFIDQTVLDRRTTDCSAVAPGTASFFCEETPDPVVAVIGDSHAQPLFYGLIDAAGAPYNRAVVVGAGGCPVTSGREERPGCTRALAAELAYVRDHPTVTTVVVAEYFGNVSPDVPERKPDVMLPAYGATLDALRAMGKRLVWVIDNPALKESPDSCVPSPLPLREVFRSSKPSCYVAEPADLLDQGFYRSVVGELRRRNPDVLFFDTWPVLCPDGPCRVSIHGDVLYRDANHLSVWASRMVAVDLARWLPHAVRG